MEFEKCNKRMNYSVAEIINVCGYWYKVQFFNVNDGEVLIYQDEIKNYLV